MAGLTIILVGVASLAMRLSFTVLADPARLPAAVRGRLDVVGPATFAALIGTSLSGVVGTPDLVPAVAGVAAAWVAARRTPQLIVPVLAAVAAATAASVLVAG